MHSGSLLGVAAQGDGAGFRRLARGYGGAGAPIIGGPERAAFCLVRRRGVAAQMGGEALFG